METFCKNNWIWLMDILIMYFHKSIFQIMTWITDKYVLWHSGHTLNNSQSEYWIEVSDLKTTNKMVSISPVFKWHSKTGPFGIWPLFDHLNTELDWYSDPHCNYKDKSYFTSLLLAETAFSVSEQGRWPLVVRWQRLEFLHPAKSGGSCTPSGKPRSHTHPRR